MRNKLAILIILAAIGGCVVGAVEAHGGYRVWPLWAGLVGVVAGICWLGYRWVALPLEQLLAYLERQADRPAAGRKPVPSLERQDEVGRLARVVNRFMTAWDQDRKKSNRLRRSLDHGVEQATRRATHQLKQLAMHDPLTGLGNRRFLDEHLDPLFQSVQSSGTQLVCHRDRYGQLQSRQRYAGTRGG